MLDSLLIKKFEKTRALTKRLCDPLEIEDFVVQTLHEVSPPKWHLAHTSWFFDRFVLKPFQRNYREFHPEFHYLFNSYYVSAGEFCARGQRGWKSRPTVREIFQYRDWVNQNILELNPSTEDLSEVARRIELGTYHECQHQELMLMDILHIFSGQKIPYAPAHQRAQKRTDLVWKRFEEKEFLTGMGGQGFSYDNEKPEHRQIIPPFSLANRLVTCGEYLEFIEDGGYQNPALWLSDGWDFICENKIECPLYWRKNGTEYRVFDLSGEHELIDAQPVAHVSYYEAEAFARWAQARLPTEFELEFVAGEVSQDNSNTLETQRFVPMPWLDGAQGVGQIFGDLWEWTCSAYLPYPGFRSFSGTLGEYNGKFMVNQMVLRGGSFASPRESLRASYRNYFLPHSRWQFSGLRLARDAD